MRLAHETDATAAAAFWLIWYPNFCVPMIVWGMSEAMSTYVQRAEQDPLTEVAGRDQLGQLIGSAPPRRGW